MIDNITCKICTAAPPHLEDLAVHLEVFYEKDGRNSVATVAEIYCDESFKVNLYGCPDLALGLDEFSDHFAKAIDLAKAKLSKH